MEKLMIYGGSGFIGGNYARRFPENVEVLRRDALCSTSGKDAINFVATTNNYHVFDDLKIDIDTNLHHLLKVLPNVPGTFNHISSWFCYGSGYDRKENAASEKSYCNPKGFYSICKRTSEQLLESYCNTFNKNYRIIRLCNVIGGDFGANKKKNATEFLIEKIINNEDIEIYDGDNYRNYLHVDDVCDAINLIIKEGKFNEIYNVGAPISHRLIDLMEYAIQKTGSKSKIKLVPTPRFHQIVQAKDFWMDTRKLMGLGFAPKYTVYDAIDKIIAQKLNNK